MEITKPSTWATLPAPGHPDVDAAAELEMLRAVATAIIEDAGLSVRLEGIEPGYNVVEVLTPAGTPRAEIHVVVRDKARKDYGYGVFSLLGSFPGGSSEFYTTSPREAARLLK